MILIYIAGMWLNVAQVMKMEDIDGGCRLSFPTLNAGGYVAREDIPDVSCKTLIDHIAATAIKL